LFVRADVASQINQRRSGGSAMSNPAVVSDVDPVQIARPDSAKVAVRVPLVIPALMLPCAFGRETRQPAERTGHKVTTMRAIQYEIHARSRCRGRQRLVKNFIRDFW
jgi:hypothetical protein